jgi:ferritin-like metal-binding protein YciE
MKEAAQLLNQTLQEEKQTDELLNKIAMNRVNRQAA